eukprot:COSAG06_NODE_3733_length_4965_cov_2.387176_2_plen_212_part_00
MSSVVANPLGGDGGDGGAEAEAGGDSARTIVPIIIDAADALREPEKLRSFVQAEAEAVSLETYARMAKTPNNFHQAAVFFAVTGDRDATPLATRLLYSAGSVALVLLQIVASMALLINIMTGGGCGGNGSVSHECVMGKWCMAMPGNGAAVNGRGWTEDAASSGSAAAIAASGAGASAGRMAQRLTTPGTEREIHPRARAASRPQRYVGTA